MTTVNNNVNVIKEKNDNVVEKKIYLERKKVETSTGKEIYNYMVNGHIGPREIHADFTPKDNGGYEVLDIMFNIQPKAELTLSEGSMTDENGKETSKYTIYTAQVTDEDGTIFTCGVKPARDSDKSLFNMILAKMSIKK